jgi:hypothetical protein
LASISVYCMFIKPKVNHETVYVDRRQNHVHQVTHGRNSQGGHALGGSLSSHAGSIVAAPYEIGRPHGRT